MIIDCSESGFAVRRQNRLPLYGGLLLMGCLSPAFADNWEPMTGADTLHEFVAGATAEISLTPEVTAVGKYNADGTAQIRAWNETFLRSWSVKGDDQVCYSSDTDTNCFRFERNLDDPAAYRSQNVKTGEWVMFRVVEGEDDYDTSITGGQYFYTFNIGGGWQINGSPTFSYNHKASSDNKWTFPLAIGVSKTVILSGRPWKLGVQYWHYVETPDAFGPDYQVRFSVSPVIKLPW